MTIKSNQNIENTNSAISQEFSFDYNTKEIQIFNL